MRNHTHGRIQLGLSLASVLACALPALAQGEVEPNDPCDLAQELDGVSLPFELAGSLDDVTGFGDVDFFRFTGTPNGGITAHLMGAASGRGTLVDPFLGLFDSECRLVAINDDGGLGFDSRLSFEVPPDGVFVLAVTSCCDSDFIGNPLETGSYVLALEEANLAGSVRGRATDALHGGPLPGGEFPFAFVQLFRCEGEFCFDPVNSQPTDASGEFRFSTDFTGARLAAGTYRIEILANLYEGAIAGPFELGTGEHLDLGDIPLTPFPVIDSIHGRLVDGSSGNALPGNAPPFAEAQLLLCEDFGCFAVAFAAADSAGRFRFDRDPSGSPLPTGAYQVLALASEYREARTDVFEVGEGEEVDLGDLALLPFPVRFSEIRPCGDLPPEGGFCRFSVRVTNRLNESVEGWSWSLVESSDIGSLTGFTQFQAGMRRIRLSPGESTVARFLFHVPASVREGAVICSQVFFGNHPMQPFFNTVGQRELFCMIKGLTGSFSVASDREAKEVFRSLRGERPARIRPGASRGPSK